MRWRTAWNINSFNEDVFVEFFRQAVKTFAPNSLPVIFTTLKNTMQSIHNVNIGRFASLKDFLSQIGPWDACDQRSQAVTGPTIGFSNDEICKFLTKAPDFQYLAIKVTVCIVVSVAMITRKNDFQFVGCDCDQHAYRLPSNYHQIDQTEHGDGFWYGDCGTSTTEASQWCPKRVLNKWRIRCHCAEISWIETASTEGNENWIFFRSISARQMLPGQNGKRNHSPNSATNCRIFEIGHETLRHAKFPNDFAEIGGQRISSKWVQSCRHTHIYRHWIGSKFVQRLHKERTRYEVRRIEISLKLFQNQGWLWSISKRNVSTFSDDRFGTPITVDFMMWLMWTPRTKLVYPMMSNSVRRKMKESCQVPTKALALS